MNEFELRMRLSRFAPNAMIFIADGTYAEPSEDWVLGAFSKYYRRKTFGWGIFKWTPKWDCDDFSAMFAALAQVRHAKTRKGRDEEGLAIGEYWYEQDTGGGHAINIAFVGRPDPIFVEPQTCKRVELSPEERSSCFFCRF